MPIASIDVTNCADLTTDAVHKYFSQLNPIAEHISADIDATKLTYGNLWHKLKLHQQNDIINETLIKPELVLRYFDNFAASSSTSSSTSSKSFCERNLSKDSLSAVALQSMKTVVKDMKKPKLLNVNNIYAFDLRNLNTFAIQKVALKWLIHDDPKGEYRDEHSKPFSFRTKSQINLFIEQIPKTDEILYTIKPPTHNVIKNTVNYCFNTNINMPSSQQHHQQNDENIKGINIKLVEPTSTHTPSNALDFKDKLKAINTQIQSKFSDIKHSNYAPNDGVKKSSSAAYAKASILASTPMQLSYAIYTSVQQQQENEESEKLMQNYCNYNKTNCKSDLILTAASSSSTISNDDDIYADVDNYEKTLGDGVKLLDDMNLRSGFDFLNNW